LRVFGFGDASKIALVATAPLIFAGLKIALAVSFVALVAAEFVASKTGIGYLIWIRGSSCRSTTCSSASW
jgi:ABC-type nitrate/sulfonate/bicarbonate transport system permease component